MKTIKDLKIGDIIYSVPYSCDESDVQFEIYELRYIGYPGRMYVLVELSGIVGSPHSFLCIPRDIDFNELTFLYYSEHCIWAYTTNEQKAIEYYRNYLNKKDCLILNMWNVLEDKWMIHGEV